MCGHVPMRWEGIKIGVLPVSKSMVANCDASLVMCIFIVKGFPKFVTHFIQARRSLFVCFTYGLWTDSSGLSKWSRIRCYKDWRPMAVRHQLIFFLFRCEIRA